MEKAAEAKLVRAIRRWDIVGVVINGIIGAGIFVLPAKSFNLIGSYSLIAFVVCAIVAALIILCFAEVSSRFDGTGGPYLYAREAFGPAVGFQVGWMNWIARVTAYATNCNLMVVYLSFFWSPAATGWRRATIITAVTLILTLINYIGVRDATFASNFFAIAKLVPLFIFIAVGCFFLTPANFHLPQAPPFGTFSTAVLLLVYAFTGFENASVPAGEMINPRRSLPFATLVGVAIVTVTYVMIQVVAIGTLPNLGGSERPLADAANTFLGPVGGSIIAAGAVISVIGNLNVNILTTPRILFAMSNQHELPQFVSAVHRRFRTPHISILITAMLMLVLTLSSTLIYALTVSTIARLIAYATTCAALPRLRQKHDAPAAAVKIRGGVVISVLAILLSLWLLSNSTRIEARDSAIALAVGIAIFFGYGASRRITSASRAANAEEEG